MFLNYPQRLWITLWKTSPHPRQAPARRGFPYFASNRSNQNLSIKSMACGPLPNSVISLMFWK
jgi:hypothetical protein